MTYASVSGPAPRRRVLRGLRRDLLRPPSRPTTATPSPPGARRAALAASAARGTPASSSMRPGAPPGRPGPAAGRRRPPSARPACATTSSRRALQADRPPAPPGPRRSRRRWWASRLARAFSSRVGERLPLEDHRDGVRRARRLRLEQLVDAPVRRNAAAVRFHAPAPAPLGLRRAACSSREPHVRRRRRPAPARARRWPSIRSTVPRSNRSVLYFSPPRRPSGGRRERSDRSNLATATSAPTPLTAAAPGARRPGRRAFCSVNITWNSGEWLRSRSGCSSSTSCSKGRSWCAYAPSVASRTRRSSSRKLGSPDRSVRSTSVLTKKPISPSISAAGAPGDRGADDHVLAARCSATAAPGRRPAAP